MAITLEAARINKSLTQEEAAKALGITRGTLISYESGKVSPRISMAFKMAKLYETTVDELIFFDED